MPLGSCPRMGQFPSGQAEGLPTTGINLDPKSPPPGCALLHERRTGKRIPECGTALPGCKGDRARRTAAWDHQ